MSKALEVITFGESMVLFSPDSKGPLRHIHSFHKSMAGAESNVAIALSRLGHNVGWFSKVGDDEFGRYLEFMVRGEGVDVSRLIKDKKHSTGLLFKELFAHVNPNVYYYRKNSAASFLEPQDLDSDYLKNTKILHVTGITPAISASAKETALEAIKIAKDAGVKISFDPNIRLKLWPLAEAKATLLEFCSYADILFPGIDESEILLGTKEPTEILAKFHAMGASEIALKMGKEGCMVSDGTEAVFVPGFVVEKIVDTVGAGDGFAAGYLSSRLKGMPIAEAGSYANGIGAMATMVKGDSEGYPTFEQLQIFIGKEQGIDR
ncbi:sugar kinase [Croceivirga sp. JEA036]|uniref:sugar kinase n=1 Tax=Croceivirga sp. JEA036 TaxID=2721162 RepID=UPI00143BF06D|nr:sugar kinase [Croceivirga sp. JEA036]NJB37856.1 sugar kinase [Croceivirga sp. JEA036]